MAEVPTLEVEQTQTATTAVGLLDTFTGGLSTFLNFKLIQQSIRNDQLRQTGTQFQVGSQPPQQGFTLAGLPVWQAVLLVLGVGFIGFGVAKAFGK